MQDMQIPLGGAISNGRGVTFFLLFRAHAVSVTQLDAVRCQSRFGARQSSSASPCVILSIRGCGRASCTCTIPLTLACIPQLLGYGSGRG